MNMIDNFNDIFFVGVGAILTQDVVREACSLLLNADERTVTELKQEFDNRIINRLCEKLLNHVNILKATSFVFILDMKINQQQKIMDLPSHTLFYNCLLDFGYIRIDFGDEKLFNVACMAFSLRSASIDTFVCVIDYKGIQEIKNNIGNQPTEFEKLEKVLSLIRNNAVFDASPSSSKSKQLFIYLIHDDGV